MLWNGAGLFSDGLIGDALKKSGKRHRYFKTNIECRTWLRRCGVAKTFNANAPVVLHERVKPARLKKIARMSKPGELHVCWLPYPSSYEEFLELTDAVKSAEGLVLAGFLMTKETKEIKKLSRKNGTVGRRKLGPVVVW